MLTLANFMVSHKVWSPTSGEMYNPTLRLVINLIYNIFHETTFYTAAVLDVPGCNGM